MLMLLIFLFNFFLVVDFAVGEVLVLACSMMDGFGTRGSIDEVVMNELLMAGSVCGGYRAIVACTRIS